MQEMLIAIFDTEEAAAKGLQTLRDLHRDGGISLYGSALIVKDCAGKIGISEQRAAQPLGTTLGLLPAASSVWSVGRVAPRSARRSAPIWACSPNAPMPEST